MAAEELAPVPFTSTAKATSLVDAISERDWEAALQLTDLACDSLAEAAQLDPFELALEVRCSVKGQAPWQIKLKTRAERCTGIYEPVTELVNGRPCYKKVGSDKDGDGQVWLCYTSNGPGHERYMIQHVRVKGHSKGYARCKLTDTSSSNSSSSLHGGSPLVVPAPHQVALWQVHDGIDWSVCEDFVVLPVLPIPLLAALDHAQPSPRVHSLALPTWTNGSRSNTVTKPEHTAASVASPSTETTFSPSPSLTSPATATDTPTWSSVPHALWASVVGGYLSGRDILHGFTVSTAFVALMSGCVAQQPQWRVVEAVARADPKASESRTRSGDLPRDVACAKGAPFEVLDLLVRLTPYSSIDEAVFRGAHRVHVQAMIASSPLARGLEMLGFGAMEIGRLMADRSLGLVSEQDLAHLRYDELVRAGVTAVSARKAMARLQHSLEYGMAPAPSHPPSSLRSSSRHHHHSHHNSHSGGGGGGSVRAEDDVGAPCSPPPPPTSHHQPSYAISTSLRSCGGAIRNYYWENDERASREEERDYNDGGGDGQNRSGHLQRNSRAPSLRWADAITPGAATSSSSSSGGGGFHSDGRSNHDHSTVAVLEARLLSAEALSAERHAALAGQLELLARHSVEAAKREAVLTKQVQQLTETLSKHLIVAPSPASLSTAAAAAASSSDSEDNSCSVAQGPSSQADLI